LIGWTAQSSWRQVGPRFLRCGTLTDRPIQLKPTLKLRWGGKASHEELPYSGFETGTNVAQMQQSSCHGIIDYTE
jgi:hypothetical protein